VTELERHSDFTSEEVPLVGFQSSQRSIEPSEVEPPQSWSGPTPKILTHGGNRTESLGIPHLSEEFDRILNLPGAEVSYKMPKRLLATLHKNSLKTVRTDPV
jgi:hypothetical protein